MSNAYDDFDIEPRIGASSNSVQPSSTPALTATIRLSRALCKTILITGACGSTQTTGKC